MQQSLLVGPHLPELNVYLGDASLLHRIDSVRQRPGAVDLATSLRIGVFHGHTHRRGRDCLEANNRQVTVIALI